MTNRKVIKENDSVIMTQEIDIFGLDKEVIGTRHIRDVVPVDKLDNLKRAINSQRDTELKKLENNLKQLNSLNFRLSDRELSKIKATMKLNQDIDKYQNMLNIKKQNEEATKTINQLNDDLKFFDTIE